MSRLTLRSTATSHENGVCCTHFKSKECENVAGNCSFGCKWEEEVWEKLAYYEDLEEQGRLLEFPCKLEDTVYRIVKYCEENTGYKNFYKPSIEFTKNCIHYEPQNWDIPERCKACDDWDDADYCSLYLDILHDACKERFAIRKEKFQLSMRCQIYNTPMFDEKTSLRDVLFLSQEEAEKVLAEYIAGRYGDQRESE